MRTPTRPSILRLVVVTLLSGLLALPALLLAAAVPASAQLGVGGVPLDPTNCVNDVERQITELKHHPEALGFQLGEGAGDPTRGRHYQGVSRIPYEPDTAPPRLVVSRNGNTGPGEIAKDGPGELIVVEMGSRNRSGERMRSNRLAVGRNTDETAPPDEDSVIETLEFDGNAWPEDPQALPAYRHLGGMQMWGDIAVVGMDTKFGPSTSEGMIVMIDLRDADDPVKLREFPVPHKASWIGISPTPGGLLLLTGGHNANPVFGYKLSTKDFRSPDLTMAPWFEYDAVAARIGWPESYDSLQTANLVRECGSGKVYLLGAHHGGIPLPDSGHEWVQLWEVTPDAEQKLRFVHQHVPVCDYDAADRVCNFAAASGYYVSPNGDLLLYATPHDNDGPKADGEGTVPLAEFSSPDGWDQPGSYRPKAVAGTYQAIQNQGVALDGTASRGAVASARLELLDDLGGRSLVIDWPDMGLRDYRNLKNVDKFNDKASYARYNLPSGCEAVLHEDPGYRGRQVVLKGTGTPEVTRLADFDNKTSAVHMTGESCDGRIVDYYWDLGEEGNIDGRGPTPTVVPTQAGKIPLGLDVFTNWRVPSATWNRYGDRNIGHVDVKGIAVIPTTKATLTGTAGNSDWYRGAVTVALTATGVPDPTQITFSATGADPRSEQTVDGASASLVVDAQGETTVYFRAANAAGEEQEQSVTVKVDSIAPTVSVVNPAPNGTYSLNFSLPVQASCADAGSGVEACLPAGTPLDTTSAGGKALTATATDIAGNSTSLPIPYTVTATPATGPELVVEAIDERHHARVLRLNADGTNVVQLMLYGEDPSWSPDGSRIAFVQPGEAGRRQVYVMNRDGSNVVRLTNESQYSAGSPVWSPDGSRIVYAGVWTEIANDRAFYHSAVLAVPAGGGGTTKLASVDGKRISDPAFTREGSAIAFVADHEVRSIPATGVPAGQLGTALVTGLDWYQDPARPAFSPDGQTMVFSLSTREVSTSDLYAKTGTADPVNLTGTHVAWPPAESTTAPNEFGPTFLPDGRVLFTQDGDLWAMPNERLGAKTKLADLTLSVRNADALGA